MFESIFFGRKKRETNNKNLRLSFNFLIPRFLYTIYNPIPIPHTPSPFNLSCMITKPKSSKPKTIRPFTIRTRSNRDPTRDFIPIPKYTLSKNRIEKKSKYIINPQCLAVNDRYYTVEMDPIHNERLNEIIPVLTNPHTLDDGIYTYVILSFEEHTQPAIYAVKTLNTYELGTKHHQLVHRVIACKSKDEHDTSCKKFRLYYAGEMRKTDDTLLYNFYSGTFKMAKKIPKSEYHTATMFMDTLLHRTTNNKYTIQFVDHALFTADTLQVSQHDLELYRQVGAKVYGFPTKQQCNEYLLFSKHWTTKEGLSKPHNDPGYIKVKEKEEEYLKHAIGGGYKRRNKTLRLRRK